MGANSDVPVHGKNCQAKSCNHSPSVLCVFLTASFLHVWFHLYHVLKFHVVLWNSHIDVGVLMWATDCLTVWHLGPALLNRCCLVAGFFFSGRRGSLLSVYQLNTWDMLQAALVASCNPAQAQCRERIWWNETMMRLRWEWINKHIMGEICE